VNTEFRMVLMKVEWPNKFRGNKIKNLTRKWCVYTIDF
jgi:hypothetical protein